MFFELLAVLSFFLSTTISAAVPVCGNAAPHVMKRQMNESSVCTTSGVDFQDGGHYFINTNSNDPFTFVSKFEGCNNGTADLQLVNQDTGDQYECGQVPTVPDGAPQTATCPVRKDQLTSGKYLIIAIGNNGNGHPFASQREFTINAGPQQTITEYPVATTTTTPVVVANSTQYVDYNSTAPNTLTTTEPPTTRYSTVTPSKVTSTRYETITRTSTTVIKANSISTVAVTPTCHVPKRPHHPDPNCNGNPGRVQLPKSPGIHAIRKRAPDQSATTVTASGNATVATYTAQASTQTSVVTVTSTYHVTAPPQTVSGSEVVQTVTASASTDTEVRTVYTTTYVTKNVGWTWTRTVTTIPPALATECKNKGGHFGHSGHFGHFGHWW